MSDATPPASSTAPSTLPASPRPSWLQTLRVYLEPASLRMLTLGFSAGLPLLLVLGTLSFRLREAGIDRSTIGYLSWVGLAYGFKWVWAPLVDRLPIPLLTRWLGRRRSWLLLSQCLVVAGLVGMALADPRDALGPIVWCALAVAFGSATQDIALDAFRIESADANHQAALAASYQTGYRLAMIWAGAGVLWIADRSEVLPALGQAASYQNQAWMMAYLVMAVSMVVGMVTVLFSNEPARVQLPPAKNLAVWLQGAVVEPFADFLRRYGWHAALILALIAVYRISDVVMGIMANPFYVDMGYTKAEVATVTKIYGVVMTLLGAFVGGVLSMRFGVMRILMLGALLSAGSNLLFAWLAAHLLQLEVQESAGLHEPQALQALMQHCHQTLGVRWAIDDFGIGKATLAWVAQVPADTLKIDRSIAGAVLHSTEDAAVVSTAVAMAQALGHTLVAEGAESPAHCTRLRELGCQVVQGYAIAHPMPGGEVADWARSYRRSVASTLVLP
eukprot:gene35287-43505_t